ncbi:hypothetical protein MPSEU_000303800 [Mayamaea pseudoterrestris]|nr:hypothetical protein MPSEU_000303800 [Mayamaea pseudoterrestris]
MYLALLVCWWSVFMAPATSLEFPSAKTSARRSFFDNPSRRNFIKATFDISMITIPIASNARNMPESTGADASLSGSLEALVPIVSMQSQLQTLQSNLKRLSKLEDATRMIEGMHIPNDEVSFKRLFDAYSDNVSYKQKFVDQNAFLVYYSKGFDGPGRPSIESDLPVKQTLQYGARNDAWVAWQSFLDEVQYVSKHPLDGSVGELEELLTKVVVALDSYLELALDEDRLQASKLVSR